MLSATSSLRLRTFALSAAIFASTSFAIAQSPTTTNQPIAAPASVARSAQASSATSTNHTTLHTAVDLNGSPQSTPAASEQSFTESANAGKAPSNGPGEGIKVHGHWTIDVLNPDGTRAEHRDFENSLGNPNTMVALLAGSQVPQDYMIYFLGTTSPCVTTYACAIVHSLTTLPGIVCGSSYYCVTGLTITYTFGQNPSMVLAGQMTATQAGNVNNVGTDIGICGTGASSTPTTVSPATCATGASGYGFATLTQTGISTLSVLSGQIIQFTVTITFS